MKFLLIKRWREIKSPWQPISRNPYNDEEQANKIKEKLEKEMPDREFKIIPIGK